MKEAYGRNASIIAEVKANTEVECIKYVRPARRKIIYRIRDHRYTERCWKSQRTSQHK